MDSYTDDPCPVNPVETEIEFPRFLPPRPAQVASSKRRRRISPTFWSAVNAHLAREQQGLPPDSPRLKPSLPTLKLLGKPGLGSEGAA